MPLPAVFFEQPVLVRECGLSKRCGGVFVQYSEFHSRADIRFLLGFSFSSVPAEQTNRHSHDDIKACKAAFYWISDRINKLSLAAIFAISISGIVICTIFSPFASNYPVYCVFAVIKPIFVVILAMGFCKLMLQERVEKFRVYKWLLKHNMYIYLLQAPGMYLSFMWLYPLVGQNCALCVTLCFVSTLAIDFALVALLTLIRKGLSGIFKSVKKDGKA